MSVYLPPALPRTVVEAAICPRCGLQHAIESHRYRGYLFCTACYLYWQL